MQNPTPLFVCAQIGARRGYAVPSILAKEGMLDRFYTDLVGNTGLGRIVAAFAKFAGKGSSIAKLAGRQIPDNILGSTCSIARPDLWCLIQRLWTKRDPTSLARIELIRSNAVGKAASQLGFGQATHLYVMMDELGGLKTEAKSRNLTVVSEIFILLSTNRIVKEERERFPDWEPVTPDHTRIREELLPPNSLFHCVDYFVCPSEAVVEDLRENWNVPARQIILVPYGMDPKWLNLEPAPKPGRILFVGSADLRKGIHYLAKAAEILRLRGRDYEFRVAGNVASTVRQRPECKNLNFLGRVPRNQVHAEFQAADVFVLPSLAEGSAEVTYEALASALPIVTTKASGSVARDGVEGRIVPERDPVALADAIDSIVQDRAMRERFASAARQRAHLFTWQHYGVRLTTELRTKATSARKSGTT